jgi:Protein of unknown function (DUF2442)
MSIAINPNTRVMKMSVNGDAVTADLADGRIASVPLSWFWRLSEATPEQRSHFEIIGHGVHWPDVDEDISAEGMLCGTPARRPRCDSCAPSADPRIKHVSVDEDAFTAELMDGRVVSVPLTWSWRLSQATPAQRANFEIISDGDGIHWPQIDEDISAEGMLCGTPARRPLARGR